MKNEELNSLSEQLKEKGVTLGRLAVVFLGGMEMIVGEVFEKGITRLKNPKRLVRITQQAQQGIAINNFISDLDGLEGDGTISVINPSGFYYVSEQSETSQINFCKMMLNYFNQRDANRAAQAGIITPKFGLQR